ncbi:hypothetical protein JYU34_014150 [Plutella xylostella]|uniref:Uncharacterized protein n=1 Tax=Plutella xylostella TaxID=51655 RepID=A0ABQ7Q8N3_PLUXY|nr:hypothetical protein JYU34_014150 [Plutella xylostella]
MRPKIGVKRKLSTDYGFESFCCKRLSILACACAVFSLLIDTYQFVESDWDVEARSDMSKIQDDILAEKIELYLSQLSESTSRRIKRGAMLQKPAAPQEDNTVAPHVEFFNPKMRAELEEKDAAEMRKTGAKGPAPGGDTWVWLTSYSRVPVSIYCVLQGTGGYWR